MPDLFLNSLRPTPFSLKANSRNSSYTIKNWLRFEKNLRRTHPNQCQLRAELRKDLHLENREKMLDEFGIQEDSRFPWGM